MCIYFINLEYLCLFWQESCFFIMIQIMSLTNKTLAYKYTTKNIFSSMHFIFKTYLHYQWCTGVTSVNGARTKVFFRCYYTPGAFFFYSFNYFINKKFKVKIFIQRPTFSACRYPLLDVGLFHEWKEFAVSHHACQTDW